MGSASLVRERAARGVFSPAGSFSLCRRASSSWSSRMMIRQAAPGRCPGRPSPGPVRRGEAGSGSSGGARRRAERGDQFRLVEAAQEVLRGADDLRGAAHRVGGVVLVVEHVVGLGHVTSIDEGPGAEAPGPRVTGLKHHLPTGSSGCRIRTGRRDGIGCEDRISVTGDHLSFDGNCGVRPRAGTACWRRAIQRCSALPFLCFYLSLPVVLSAGVGAPRNFMAPTRAANPLASGEALNEPRPHLQLLSGPTELPGPAPSSSCGTVTSASLLFPLRLRNVSRQPQES